MMNINRTLKFLLFGMLLIPCLAYSTGAKIAYLANTDGYWQVWVMNQDGSEKRQITKSSYDKSHISWFPDSVEILVNGSQGKLTRINTTSLKVTEMILPIKGTVDAVISPNGKKIIFSLSVADSKDNNHIWRVDVDGNELTKITNMEGLQHEPVWSHDSKSIYFLSGTGEQSHNIWRVSLEDKVIEQVTVNQLYNFDVAFSANGDMAFSSNRSGNYEIWLQRKSGLEKITNNTSIDSRPSLSPNGKNIVFESLRSGVMNIWAKSLITSELKQLTDEPVGARFPIWSH